MDPRNSLSHARTHALTYRNMSIPSPLQHVWVSGSTHSFGSLGAPNCTSPLGDVGALALYVIVLFPKICCSLQSANPQAIEKALHQVTCAHPICGSLPAAPPTAVAPAGVRLLTASIRPGWRQQCWQGNFSHCQARFWSLLRSTPASFTPDTNFLAAFIFLKLIPSLFQKSLCHSLGTM